MKVKLLERKIRSRGFFFFLGEKVTSPPRWGHRGRELLSGGSGSCQSWSRDHFRKRSAYLRQQRAPATTTLTPGSLFTTIYTLSEAKGSN